MSNFSEVLNAVPGSSLLDYKLTSRVQTIDYNGIEVGVKRDDELSCTISGSKFRKYASLVPYLLENGFTHVVSEGSEYSNNICGLAQLLNEYEITYTFFLKEGSSKNAVNGKLLKLLAPEKSLKLIKKSDWKSRQQIISNYIETLNSEKPIFLKEGSDHFSAIPGSMTLAYDIEISKYSSIYIDAGTGVSFIGLYLGLCQRGYKGTVYVISLFENRSYFEQKISECIKTLNLKPFENMANFEVIYPEDSKSFGSSTSKTMQNIEKLAKGYGILTDPLYSGRSIPRALDHILEHQNKNALVIHSGGSIALSGFI